MKKILEFFSHNHILTNFIVIGVFIGAVIMWNETGKEDMPSLTMDFLMVSASYPGATAEEVEYFLTKEFEDAVLNIEGVHSVTSRTSEGSASLFINLLPNLVNRDEAVSSIEDAVNRVSLPDDATDPNIREFKSNQRSVGEYMIYYDGINILSEEKRKNLREYADALEDRLENVSSVSDISVSGRTSSHIEVQVNPEKLKYYDISISDVISALKNNNVKLPLGSLSDENSTKLRLNAELNHMSDISNLILKSDFEGNHFRIRDVANVVEIVKEQEYIQKCNGNESISISMTKTADSGIIEAMQEIKSVVAEFEDTVLRDTGVNLFLMNDGSQDVRDRIKLIALNGTIGFILILIILFIFLNAKSAIWVAMGIPFTFGVTMIVAPFLGHNINNMTLAAVIIVMGIIVDDAIVISENISRLKEDGVDGTKAAIDGTLTMIMPIFASITTTIAAFVPLLFFEGRFGMLIKFIPPIIFIMLIASFFESIFILPSHLIYRFPRWLRVVLSFGMLPVVEFFMKKIRNRRKQKSLKAADPANNDESADVKKIDTSITKEYGHWFHRIEDGFGFILKYLLRIKTIIYILFIALMVYSGWYFTTNLNFVLFPREESTDLRFTGQLPEGATKYETEEAVRKVEDVFKEYIGKELVTFETTIARSRWGGEARENFFMMRLQIVPKDKRKKSVNELTDEWDSRMKDFTEFEKLAFSQRRFGQSSGSPIEIAILENNDKRRSEIALQIESYLKRIPAILNPEIEPELYDEQYDIELDRNLIERLGVSISNVASTLRTLLSGNTVFDITRDDEEISVNVTIDEEVVSDIDKLLELPVNNNGRFLIPLKNIVSYEKSKALRSINHTDGKRVLKVYADINTENDKAQKSGAGPGEMSNLTGNPDAMLDSILKEKLAAMSEDERLKITERVKEKLESMPPQQKGEFIAKIKKTDDIKKLLQSVKKSDFTVSETDQSKDKIIDDKQEEDNKIDMLNLPEYMTPLEIAEHLETYLFPDLLMKYPTATIEFEGEIANSRESAGDFMIAIILAILFIYVILALTLNSVFKPFIIMLSIPFGAIGVILMFKMHGMTEYGFFSVIGALGLSGVVVNDSIILLDKLEAFYPLRRSEGRPFEIIADITKTRLRAVLLTTITTVAGLLPTAYGVAGYDSMLSEMMLTMAWGLLFATVITLILVPALYCSITEAGLFVRKLFTIKKVKGVKN